MSGPIRGFRFRFYPTLQQRRYLARAFGTARYVFNWGLERKREGSAEHKESIGYVPLSRMLTVSKAEKPWLADVAREIRTQALRDLDKAFQNFLQSDRLRAA